MILHICGPCAAGKTSLARAIVKLYPRTQHIDGDAFRALHRDLTFTEEDRLKYMVELAKVYNDMNETFPLTVGAFVTPTKSMRDVLRKYVNGGLRFLWIDTPLATCMARDPKGLYRAKVDNLPGINFPLEKPTAERDAMALFPGSRTPEELAESVAGFVNYG